MLVPHCQVKTRTGRQRLPSRKFMCGAFGCTWISRSRLECFKHRDAHFQPAFICPGNCKTAYVSSGQTEPGAFRRASALERHMRSNPECLQAAGSWFEWGTNASKFRREVKSWRNTRAAQWTRVDAMEDYPGSKEKVASEIRANR
jgi:hypothetical protein